MQAFLRDLVELPFLQHALAAGLLASVACGVVGSFIVVRRITYIAGGIAHCILGGMGAARYAQVVLGWDWIQPLHGAVVAALGGAVIIGVVTLDSREREDTVISALWAVGMAVGVLFVSQTPGYNQDLLGYLFGNILMVSSGDLWLIAGLDAVVLVVAVLFMPQLTAVCFDEQFARLRGVPVRRYYLLLLCLTALTVVLLVAVVGIVLAIALLTLPVAVASQGTRRMGSLMVLSTLLTASLTTAGLALSYGPDLPAGAVTIVLAGALYLVVMLGGAVRHRFRRAGPSERQ